MTRVTRANQASNRQDIDFDALPSDDRPRFCFLKDDSATTGCGVIPIARYNGNKFAIDQDNCASRLMIQRIKASGSKTCPSCGNEYVVFLTRDLMRMRNRDPNEQLMANDFQTAAPV